MFIVLLGMYSFQGVVCKFLIHILIDEHTYLSSLIYCLVIKISFHFSSQKPHYPVFSNGHSMLVIAKGFLNQGALTPQFFNLDFNMVYNGNSTPP
jgi:hypothetical protein